MPLKCLNTDALVESRSLLYHYFNMFLITFLSIYAVLRSDKQ